MKFKNSLLLILAVLAISVPAMAQDSGAPDSIKMVFTTTPVNGSNVPVVVQCSVLVDANTLSTLQFAFKWDNPNFDVDSAKASAAFDAMDIGPFFFLDNILQTTNDSQIAICSGTSIFSNYPSAAGWRHIATFYGHMTSWSGSSFLKFDTVQTPTYASTEYLFLPLGGTPYQPIWKGPISFGAQAQNLTVNPALFNKVANEGGASPATDSISVGVDAGGSLAYNLSESISWLSLNKTNGNTPDKFAIIYNTSALAPGSYSDSIQVSSAGAANSPIYVKVNLTVNAVAKFLDVNPDSLQFTAQQGGSNPAAQKFYITETGGFNILANYSESSSWITLNKASGTTPDSVSVSINIAGLAPATYVDSIQVSSGSASNSPVYEKIRLTVTPAPKFLDVTPDTLSFTAVENGSNPTNQNFGVIETGGGVIAFTLSEATTWFSLNKGGGNTPDVVTVMVDITGLTPGTYYGNITVSSGEATNSPITEVIKLELTAVPKKLVASPNSLGPHIVFGDPPFSPITVHVTDSFNVHLAYNVTEDISWLNIAPSSGTTPDSFLAIADTAGVAALAPGFYQDTITITSAQATNSPIYVFVALEIDDKPNSLPVIAPIGDFNIFEGDNLMVSVTATDADDDALYLFPGSLPANANFYDSGNGNGYFTFNPNYSQAGDYVFNVHASDAKDTSSESFNVHVADKEPGTEGDTLHVGTVPAVPGQQVVVPVEIANSCDLWAVDVPFTWNGQNLIELDSIVFNGGLLAGISGKFASFDNDSWSGEFGFEVGLSEFPIPAGHYSLANLYFSVSPVTPGGAYAVTPGLTTTTFTRNCSDFGEVVVPVIPGGGGNIVVDTSNVYVCGYVVDEEGNGIWGAQVELWEDYPCEGPVQITWTNGDGAYAFTDFSLGSFDLYAWKRGEDSTTWNDAYYPNNVHVNFGENGIMIVLQSLDELVPSDLWVDYFCNENTLFNCALPVGSIVEVWDEDNTLCGRQFVRDPGVYKFMPVYRDSSGSAEDEGAVTGDELRFFINGNQALAYGNVFYPEIYAQMQVCLSGGERLTKECPLNTGWNLVSWNLDTDTDDIEDVLSSLNGCIEVVLGFEAGGLTYVPGMDIFNTLSAVDHLSGYWIRLGDDCNHNLEIQGVPVSQETPIPVRGGWNLVSYLPNDVHLIQNALYSLDGNLQIAYTYDGSPLVYVPGQDPFNTLSEMEPCFGYWVKLANAGVLTYPSINGVMSKTEWPIAGDALGSEVKFVEPTRNWVNMYSYNLTVDGRPVSVGATVTARNLAGGVIGHYIMKESGTFGFMPVYADAQGESVAGIKKGEHFYLEVDGNKTNEEFTWTDQGALIEVVALTTGAGGNNTLPDTYSLEQNYPNPFNPTTTISFSLPKATNARVEIFNLLGQVVATPFDGPAEAGEHKVVWDGKSANGASVSSGIYLYRLTADNYVKSLKMTLLK